MSDDDGVEERLQRSATACIRPVVALSKQVKIFTPVTNKLFRNILITSVAVKVRGGPVVRCRTCVRGFESHSRLLCTNANSACHPFGVG